MKLILATALVAVILLACAGCGGGGDAYAQPTGQASAPQKHCPLPVSAGITEDCGV